VIRGVIRPNGGYACHIRAGVVFLADAPREFVVDPSAQRQVLDKPGEPLVLSPAGYEYMRQEFGKALVCEPIGIADLGGATERIAQLEEEMRESHAVLEQLEQLERQLNSARVRISELEQLEEQLRMARVRIGELEAAAATSKKK
jgi:hypothetical protein